MCHNTKINVSYLNPYVVFGQNHKMIFGKMKEVCFFQTCLKTGRITCVSRVIININCIDDGKRRYTIANLWCVLRGYAQNPVSVRHMEIVLKHRTFFIHFLSFLAFLFTHRPSFTLSFSFRHI